MRSLTGARLAGTEISLDGVGGAVTVAAPSTCDGSAMQVTDRTVFTGLLLLGMHRWGMLRARSRLDTAAANQRSGQDCCLQTRRNPHAHWLLTWAVSASNGILATSKGVRAHNALHVGVTRLGNCAAKRESAGTRSTA